MSRWTIPSAWAAASPRSLDQVLDRLDDRQGSPLAHDVVQVAALDVFHHQEMDAPILVGVQRGDDVGVLELSSRLDFPLEPCHGGAIAGERGGEDLQGHHASQPPVSSLEDHAHAADAQLVEDQVVTDEQSAALALIQGGGLVGRQLAGLLESSGQTEDSHRCGNVSGQAIELVLSGQAEFEHRPAKLGRVGDRTQARTRSRLVRLSGHARPAEDRRIFVYGMVDRRTFVDGLERFGTWGFPAARLGLGKFSGR